MKIATGKLVLELENCHWCNLGPDPKSPGLMASRKVCPSCKGTRRGKRGGRDGCRQCLDGKVYDHENLITCGACDGKKFVPETRYSHITAPLWESLTFKVIRHGEGRFGFNERYLGLGNITCVSDYGTAWKENNEAALIAEVRAKHGFTQALNICNEDLTVCDYVAIIVTPQGFKIRGVYEASGVAPTDDTATRARVQSMFDPKGLAMAEIMAAQNG